MSEYNIDTPSYSIAGCQQIIMVEGNNQRPGNINALCHENGANSKHTVHSLAQVVYFQYQDKELEPVLVKTPLKISGKNEICIYNEGMCICRTNTAKIHVLISDGLSIKVFLEAAHRYCSRWIRMDI